MPCADSVAKKILSMIKGLGAKPPPGNFAYIAVQLMLPRKFVMIAVIVTS